MTRVLVYDGSNVGFQTAGRLVARTSEDLSLVPWGADRVQSFLDAQFGCRPFAFVLVDLEEGLVHVGRETVERMLRAQGVPDRAASAAGSAYPPLSGPVGRLLHGRRPADIDGTFPLTDDAREQIEAIGRNCSLPACHD